VAIKNLTALGNYTVGISNATISGNVAYLAAGENGLTLLDVSKPENLTVLSSLKTVGFVSDVSVFGNAGDPTETSSSAMLILTGVES